MWWEGGYSSEQCGPPPEGLTSNEVLISTMAEKQEERRNSRWGSENMSL